MTISTTFPLGRLAATMNAVASLTPDDILGALTRHARGDWGDLDPEDEQANERALIEGERILSAYNSDDGTRFWIITESDRSATTILLPGDY